MKKLIATVLAIVGAVITIWAGSSLLVTGKLVYGYEPLYAGLLGIALLSYGLISRQE